MKLIDILNMISKGELKEGTKVKIEGLDGYKNEYEFTNIPFELYDDKINRYDLQDSKGSYVFDEFYLSALNDEVELIEPDHFADVGKMEEKIEELDVLGIGESQNIDNLGLANSIVDLRNEIREIQHKLNEVIRRINNVR